jgi:hypothetical protein
MDQEIEQLLQQMMELLLDNIDYVNFQAAVCQDKADAKAKACQNQLKQDMNDHMEALLEGLRSYVRGMTICQLPSVVQIIRRPAQKERRLS